MDSYSGAFPVVVALFQGGPWHGRTIAGRLEPWLEVFDMAASFAAMYEMMREDCWPMMAIAPIELTRHIYKLVPGNSGDDLIYEHIG